MIKTHPDIKTKQKAIHTNGYQINYKHRNTSHTDSRSYGNHDNSHTDRSSSGWSMNGGWYANHNDRGGYDRSNYGQHSNSGYGENTTNNPVSRVDTNTVNRSPQITGSTFSKSLYYNSKSIKISLTSLSYTDDDTSSSSKYRIYYQYCSTQNGTYNNWTLLSEQTGTSYTWIATNLDAGWYKIGVTVFDGSSWSAEPSGNGWTATHSQLYTPKVVNATTSTQGYVREVVDTNEYDSTYAAVSSPIRIYHYSSPANDSDDSTNWNTNYYTKDNIEQVQGETNKVLNAMGQTQITFTNTPVVSQFTIITWADMQQLRSGVSTAYQLRKDASPSLSTQTDWVENQKIIDIQDLLDILGQGD